MLLPDDARPPDSLRLLPGQARAFPVRGFAPPFGLETYQVLLARSPADLRPALQTRGQRSDLRHPFAGWVAQGLRGEALPPVALDESGVATLQFWIQSPEK